MSKGKAVDTRRWRKGSVGEIRKILGSRNGDRLRTDDWLDADKRREKKILRRQAKREILIALEEAKEDQKPLKLSAEDPLAIPGYIPGQSFSSDWLFQRQRRWN